MINLYQEYGNCFLISVNKSISYSLIFERSNNFKGKCVFIFSDDDFYYLVLTNTFNRPAYDFYYAVHGSNIMKLETITAGALLEVYKNCFNPCCLVETIES